jgi:hypothetical protein
MSCQPCGKSPSSQGVPYVTGTQGGITTTPYVTGTQGGITTTTGQTSGPSKIPWWLIVILIILGIILLDEKS